jgi:hypothetical protein
MLSFSFLKIKERNEPDRSGGFWKDKCTVIQDSTVPAQIKFLLSFVELRITEI